MKTLFVEVVPEMGGAQQSLYELCIALPPLGIEVVVAAPQGPLGDALRTAGVSVCPIPAVRARRRGSGFVATLFRLAHTSWRISQIIRSVRPDIIHANSVTSALALGKPPPGVPRFTHVRDLRLPALAVRTAAQRSTRLIAISTALDAYLRDTLAGSAHLEKIRIIRNGIDTARFTPGDKAGARRRFALPADAPVIGMVAHLIPWKAHDTFIAAAEKIRAKHPAAQFVIAGRDLFGEHTAWGENLHRQAQSAGLQDAIHWIHDSDHAEQILPAFDILIHPAQHEPFGRVICEAMAMQIPVVAACSGGIPDIIIDGVNGLLVPDADASAIAERANALLDNPSYAHALALASRGHILQHFTKERLARQLADEYALAIRF